MQATIENQYSTFIPHDKFEEIFLGDILDSAPVGARIKGLLILRSTNTADIEQLHGEITVTRDGVLFSET
jgi:hypothetical protein